MRPLEPSRVPTGLVDARKALGDGFVLPFIERLEALGIDTVRVPGLSTAYSLHVGPRVVIVLPETGNWFHENFSLAHELGYVVLGHEQVVSSSERDVNREESDANAFAAELLLPAAELRAVGWSTLDAAELAAHVWQWGVSTRVLDTRLGALHLRVPTAINALLQTSTQALLRHHWRPDEPGDPITSRITEASTRTFPAWLKDAHLDGVAQGRLQKGTVAWMLGVDPGTLEIAEPPAPTMDDSDLMSILG